MPEAIVSPQARLRPAPTIRLCIRCSGHAFVAASLVDANGKPIEVPRSSKPTKGRCAAKVLLLADEDGALELPKLRAVPVTLHVLPRDGTGAHEPRTLPGAQPGAQVALTLKDLQEGFYLPLDLPAARAQEADAFEVTLAVEATHIHRCC